jgi:hypothetical protein
MAFPGFKYISGKINCNVDIHKFHKFLLSFTIHEYQFVDQSTLWNNQPDQSMNIHDGTGEGLWLGRAVGEMVNIGRHW